jgi:DNA-binding XRE family transcriptional regulator
VVAPSLAGDDGPKPLADIRRELDVTQVELARRLGGSQRAVSHVEHEPNPRVATLASYVEALGGRLQLRAVFADRIVGLELPPAAAAGPGPARGNHPADGAGRSG